MHATPALLKCHDYFVTELMVAANPEYERKKPIGLRFEDLQIDSEPKPLPKKLDGRLWQVVLQMQQNVGPDKNAPYNFSITLVGHFEIHPQCPAAQVRPFVAINGSSILYSSARQILNEAMRNGPFPPIALPTVSFHDTEPAAAVKKGVAESAADYGEKAK